MQRYIVIALVLGVAGTAQAYDPNDYKTCAALVGPVLEGAKIGKFRRGKRLDIFVEYLDPLGYTTVDGNGIHWHIGNKVIHATGPNYQYPQPFWGDGYPLYLIGKTMNVKIHVRNRARRRVRNLRVVAIHEYLNIFGGDGVNMPGNSTKAWFIPKLKRNHSVALEFSYYIPAGTMAGLDQTHVIITRCRQVKKHCCNRQRLFVNLPQAGIFCPPS